MENLDRLLVSWAFAVGETGGCRGVLRGAGAEDEWAASAKIREGLAKRETTP